MPARKNILGDMINFFRKKNNLTLKELGKKVGKTDATVSRWITGERSPIIEDVYKLVEIFDTDFDTLMYGNDIPTQNCDNSILALSEEELRLIEYYRKANEKNKMKIIAYVSGIIDAE
ncbi:helix-turn-helix transcriptional regulator [Listeria monocytogenes]|nr:XRE family transcriptional regulator [Listeria monocytogenes]EHW6680188.1 helix-turn-helix transcriptional regulator [Listeria monocytogenes]